MQEQISASPGALENDLACSTCGYNLRGLESHGRCPECGVLIGISIAANHWRRRTLDEADPIWLKHLLEGAWLALVVWFLILTLAVVPQELQSWLVRRHAPQRTVLLGITCVWWTLSWAAVWKLSRVEPQPNTPVRSRHRVLSSAVRVAATVYLLVPTLVVWPDNFPFKRLLVVIALGMFGCGSAVGLALWARVFSLAGLAQRPGLQIQAVVLMVASPLALWVALFNYPGGPSSLDFMLYLPLPGLGWPLTIGEAIDHLEWLISSFNWIAWFILLHALLVFAALVQLLLMLMRARRRAKTNARAESETSCAP